MKVPRLIKCTSIFLVGAGILAWSGQAGAAASSCVTCHLDQDMLTKNLKVDKVKASAKQSGAG